MKRQLALLPVIFLVASIFFITVESSFANSQETQVSPSPMTENKSCAEMFAENQQCPENLCRLQCVPWEGKPNICIMECSPKPCVEIDVTRCPLDRCEVLKGCGGTDVCYYKTKKDALHCGRIGYVGQEVQCCEEMVRRCGIEFFDHTCDMTGENSIYSIPSCIPCGNGICNQFENACNCPEDCGSGGYRGVKFDGQTKNDNQNKNKGILKKGGSNVR